MQAHNYFDIDGHAAGGKDCPSVDSAEHVAWVVSNGETNQTNERVYRF